MRRWLLTITAAASLVICLAIGVLWVRSYWRYDLISADTFRTGQIDMNKGYVRFTVWPLEHRSWQWSWDQTNESFPWQEGSDVRFRMVGLKAGGHLEPTGEVWWVHLPFWLLTLVCALPAIPTLTARVFGMVRRTRAIRARRSGICPGCGYDLRATPEQCPECGAVAEPPHNPPMQRTGREGILSFVSRLCAGR